MDETTTAELEKMQEDNRLFPSLDAKRYWTTVAVLATTAVVTFLIANWALPSKVDRLRDEIKSMRKEQATREDVEAAIGDSKDYTDKRVDALESNLKITLERVLTNQENIKADAKETKQDRKDMVRSIEEIRTDVARVKFAVETSR